MTPLLDGRDAEGILERIKKLVPLYVPQWTFDRENIEPGTALAIIFSEMLEGTLKRYNQVLDRNRMAFLNMLNGKILPANPSEAYVTFFLSSGTKENTMIPKRTKVIAELSDHGGQVVFETTQEMLATPAVPVCAYQVGSNARVINEVDPKLFCIDKLEKKGIVIFDKKDNKEDDNSENLQEHCIYFSHPVIFNVKAPVEFALEFYHKEKEYREKEIYSILSDTKKCNWQYYLDNLAGNGWKSFENDCVRTSGNSLVILKKDFSEISKTHIQGIESNFIRCRLMSDEENDIPQLEFDKVSVAGKFLNDDKNRGMVPEKLFYNDIELKAEDFNPFGVYFSIYDSFYICCNEVLSKKGSTVTLSFTHKYENNSMGDTEKKKIKWKGIMKKSDLEEDEIYKTYIETVIWEYWNGTTWTRLSMDGEYERVFDGREKNSNSDEINLIFNCPQDIEQVPMNGHFDYYIRGRITKVWNTYKPNAIYLTPRIKKISLTYEFKKKLPVKTILTKNNMDWKIYEVESEGNERHNSDLIKPFEAIGNTYPALYLGFDKAPVDGPIHLYFSIKKTGDESILFQPVWEYYGSGGWIPLKTIDNTSNFSSSGSLIFAGPKDFIKNELFENQKYWIRVYDKSTDIGLSNIEVDGIYINTERVVQQESISEEIPQMVLKGLQMECRLSRSPIISEEVFINEASELSDKEQKEILDEGIYEVKFERDDFGNIKDFWIKWIRVDDFLLSNPKDRHYISNRSSGIIVLNGTRYGKEFFKEGNKKIRISYKAGGGEKGNVPAYSINRLKNSIAFVEKVINHKPSFGGCEVELLEDAIKRQTQAIKNRDRAVTEEDFTALAMQASRNIEKVRCIPNRDANSKGKTGCITLVILPKGGSLIDDFFTGLKDEVKRYVMDKTSGVVGFEDKITVTGPVFIEYCITASVVVEDMSSIIEVENEIKTTMEGYFDPRMGNFHKKGWDIGEYPKESSFFTLIKSIPKVKYIENLIVNVYVVDHGKKRQIQIEALEEKPDLMVKNGQHQINVKVV